MVTVAVVEDDPRDAAKLKSYLGRFERENGDVKTTVVEFADGMDLVSSYKGDCDILLLDIEMPLLNGMDTAKFVREKGGECSIIFVTNMSQYALQGYEVDAIGYLVKPITYFAFAEVMKKALGRVESRRMDNRDILISTKQGVTVVPSASVIYVEVRDHDLVFHTERGDFVQGRKALKDLEATLSSLNFARSSNCYLVNLKYVLSVTNNDVKIDDKTVLPISRSKKKEFIDRLMRYSRR